MERLEEVAQAAQALVRELGNNNDPIALYECYKYLKNNLQMLRSCPRSK